MCCFRVDSGSRWIPVGFSHFAIAPVLRSPNFFGRSRLSKKSACPMRQLCGAREMGAPFFPRLFPSRAVLTGSLQARPMLATTRCILGHKPAQIERTCRSKWECSCKERRTTLTYPGSITAFGTSEKMQILQHTLQVVTSCAAGTEVDVC